MNDGRQGGAMDGAEMDDALRELEAMSNAYGRDPDCVLGGGGNTSCKDDRFLYVKPSGVRLSQIRGSDFIRMERRKIRRLFEPAEPGDREAPEARAARRLADAVEPGSRGRPSVETPLHELLPGRYVVHLHPARVNGMTCGRKGREICATLFPDALWIGYFDPGFTLACAVRDRLREHAAAGGRSPQVLFLQNHGLFVSADSPERIQSLLRDILSTLGEYAARCGVVLPSPDRLPDPGEEGRRLLRELGADPSCLVALSAFRTADGPLTPDHVVFCKAHTLHADELRPGAIEAFRSRHGYLPKVVEIRGRAVYALGESPEEAQLVAALAVDAARVVALAGAFGGCECLNDAQSRFIETWEAESYRRKRIS